MRDTFAGIAAIGLVAILYASLPYPGVREPVSIVVPMAAFFAGLWVGSR